MIPDIASFFINEQALFGAWPTQQQVDELEAWGVDVFINLANGSEKKLKSYTTTKDVLHFPIQDRLVPHDKVAFCGLIIRICRMIECGKKVYIHCKGGHGRSGVVVASILAYKYKIGPIEALALTREYHSSRVGLKPRWKIVGSPQTYNQKQFVRSLFVTHDIGTDSPFYSIKNIGNIEDHQKVFLINTFLGRIEGTIREELLEYREELLLDHSISST